MCHWNSGMENQLHLFRLLHADHSKHVTAHAAFAHSHTALESGIKRLVRAHFNMWTEGAGN